MDHSPIDIETLARIANELFRDGNSVPAPGPTAIPSAAQAIAPGLDVSGAMPLAPSAGGATFSPTSPPTGPAYGRAMSAEAPTTGYGTGQPRFGTTPSPAAHDVPIGFDPQSVPGFAPIPHVAEGFDVAALGLLDPNAAPQTFLSPANGPGRATAPVSPTSAFDPSGAPPTGLPSGTAAFSPSATPNGLSSGRAVAPEAPTTGSVPGLTTFGFPTGFDTQLPLALDPQHAGRGAAIPEVQPGFGDAPLQSFLAPTNVPGLAAAPAHPSIGGAAPLAQAPQARSIDRPTPNAFEFTDAPHLGEFPEESILRSQIGPPPGSGHADPSKVAGAALADAGSKDLKSRDFGSKDLKSNLGGITPSRSPSFYFLDDGMGYFANDVPILARTSATPFNAEAVRADFPILQQRVNGYPLVWLDNGATTQKPQAVIDRISSFYENENSNINRSAHELAARASDAYEDARKTVQRFINAPTIDELVFVRGTTEGINFVAQSFGRRFIKAGDEIVLTQAEHHANIVPWYLLAKDVGATLRVVPFDDNGEILLDEYENLLNDRVKIVAMSHVSNALGTVLPVKAMVEMAHRHGIPVLVDGAQSISHMPIDVQDIDCDFFVFSGHKVFAPTGIGTVYGKKALLDQMPPWQGGGNMIKDVTFEKITFQPAPGRFEAGTGNIADAVGLGEAFKYLERLGMTNIAQHEHALLDYATQRLASIKGLTIIGNAKEKAGVISFLLEGKPPVEVGKALNQKGIAVRAGHHCALPILRRYGVEATVRPAFAMYNTFDDADRLAEAVREIAAA